MVNNRWLRLIAIGLVLLIALLIFLAYTLVDSRKVTALAVSAVEQATGRSLQVSGPVSVTLFPVLSVIAEEVVLGNPSWAADKIMARADRMAFSVGWGSLLRHHVSIHQVQMQGVVLNLQAAPTGQKVSGNWDMSDGALVNATTTNDGKSPEGFHLESLQITDATVHFRDAAGTVLQSVGVERLTGSVKDTQVDFEGRVRWQQQPINLQGRVSYQTGTPPDVALALLAIRMDLKSAGGSGEKASTPTASQRWVFDAQPLGLALLPHLNGQVDVTIKSLVLPDGVVLPDFSSRISLSAESGGVLTLDHLRSGLGQGVINADGQIRGYSTSYPTLTLRGHAEGFTLEKVIAQANSQQKVSQIQGGPGELAFNFKATGTSLRDLASSMNGEAQLSVGAAKVSTAWVNTGGDFLVSLFDAVNPMRKSVDITHLDCAVAYLPVRNGVVSINQSIGIETDRLNVILDGQANLRNETLNIRIYPTEKSGLTTGVNAAGLVQINGTLSQPKLGMNKAGAVRQAASVGLAVFTAGISLAAQNVMSIATKRAPCQNVLRPWSDIDGHLSTGQ